jgi:hypothetical protein
MGRWRDALGVTLPRLLARASAQRRGPPSPDPAQPPAATIPHPASISTQGGSFAGSRHDRRAPNSDWPKFASLAPEVGNVVLHISSPAPSRPHGRQRRHGL